MMGMDWDSAPVPASLSSSWLFPKAMESFLALGSAPLMGWVSLIGSGSWSEKQKLSMNFSVLLSP